MTLKKQSPIIQSIEVTLLAIIIIFFGYHINPNDPLLIHYDFSFLILWLAIVTLFFGLSMGLLMWIIFATVVFFFYKNDSKFVSVLLENLFFVFLFGLFFSTLHQELNGYKIKTKYLRLRLKELTDAFFTLKISHDKLESIYITQPASIRFVISEILQDSEHNTPVVSAKNSLRILKKFFLIQSAGVYRVKKNRITKEFFTIGDMDKNINSKDRLIEDVLLYKRAIYINDLHQKEQTNYIYAVPFIDKRYEVVAILIIKEMPFLFYNQDILLKISVVFNYIWTEYKKRASLRDIKGVNTINEKQDLIDFKLEIVRLKNILDGFKIDSRVYALITKDEYINQEIEEFLYQNNTLDILEQYISIKCKDNYIHLILFPFVSLATMYDYVHILDKKLNSIGLKTRIDNLTNQLDEYIGKKSNLIIKKHVSIRGFDSLLEEFNCAT